MINFLQGVIVEKLPTRLIIDVNGVGYEVNITLHCYESLGSVGEKATVITYLHVREDILQLFGFKSTDERDLFLQLISTPGIGPRKAQVILSSVSVEHLQKYIFEEDLAALTSLSGVGRKTAQRLILDLKDKIKPSLLIQDKRIPSEIALSEKARKVDEALTALISLGFTKNNAQLAIQKVMRQSEQEPTLEEIIKQALRLM
ncbi:MAG: Holliday junction branch migration protein RuvA [bacterium]|nr:MAG: Holliday junction branch migration protein RuvA [bacterium]